MKWNEACDASINDRAKRDNGEDEIWLIVDRDTVTISYEITDKGTGKRTEGPRGPVARVIVPGADDNGDPVMITTRTVDVTTIEKFDDWRPSVPRIIVEEVESLDELEDDDPTEDLEEAAVIAKERLSGFDELLEELGE